MSPAIPLFAAVSLEQTDKLEMSPKQIRPALSKGDIRNLHKREG
jgi:hypothetical protein